MANRCKKCGAPDTRVGIDKNTGLCINCALGKNLDQEKLDLF